MQTNSLQTEGVSRQSIASKPSAAKTERTGPVGGEALEPGLLPVLRIYVFLRFGAMVLVAGVFLGGIGVPFEPEFIPTGALFLLEIIFFLVYLYWPPVQKKLGSLYLPIALLAASAGPILEMRYVFTARQPGLYRRVLVDLPVSQHSVDPDGVAVQLPGGGLVLCEHGDVGLRVGDDLPSGSPLPHLLQRWIRAHPDALLSGHRQGGIDLDGGTAVPTPQLARANRRLVRYASTIEQLSVTRERNRLAQEMHDTLAHTLSALAVELDALSTVWTPEASRARRILDHALSTTRNGLDETRRALRDMRASPLEDLGLARAVRNLARNTADRCGLQLTLKGSEDFGDLPPEVEHTYYRVAQEALENVVRHADADALVAGLEWQDHQLVLTIQDDGKGLPDAMFRDPSHFGLRGMCERADFIGGDLTIRSDPDEGTTIVLRTEIHDAWRDL